MWNVTTFCRHISKTVSAVIFWALKLRNISNINPFQIKFAALECPISNWPNTKCFSYSLISITVSARRFYLHKKIPNVFRTLWWVPLSPLEDSVSTRRFCSFFLCFQLLCLPVLRLWPSESQFKLRLYNSPGNCDARTCVDLVWMNRSQRFGSNAIVTI